ncbi:TetR/AcrR family transcriptional regulator C-terminal domain-containing protein [Kribbella kalugense]|uniref:TetR family transcriptional regulator n=1 Tax=Kribbella kalugense TaxID=2512221 RepID=A0A4R7ZE43_9ACTN|nr:TetR/AcrR family transcriptional regulator C-terminal domain-containing protein [Kribbella kalugense]TDW15829.1 TetR family transcriptional regulator [Kribbella kalugense]
MPDRTPPTRPALNREYIAEVALDLIDRIGLATFSMRKLGAELGADPMAAYRHFADQEDLYDGIAELLFDRLDADSLPWATEWTELATAYCERLRTTLLEHPQAVTVFASRPVRSPAAIGTGNRMLESLQAAGFGPADALRITRCLREYTIGHALTMAVPTVDARRRSRKPAPTDPAYNLLAEAADGATPGDHFDPGLQAMLNGFSAGRGRTRGRR